MADPGTRRRRPVLVVDDEQFFRDLMTNVLTGEGFEVHTAASGAEALDLFEPGRYPVVIMDLVLPDMLGTEVLPRIKDKDPSVAVIMVTAYASMDSAIDALKAGAYDYIKKPIVREELVTSLLRALERQYLAEENRALLEQLESQLAQMQTMIREKEEIFRILDEGLIVLEDDGTIFDLNPRAAAILGDDGSPLVGRSILMTRFPVPGDLLDELRRGSGPVRRMVQAGGEGEGSTYVQIVALAMKGSSGRGGFLLSLRDLTGIRELERNREEFLSVVSHDLRAPLTSLKGFVELLLSGDYRSEQSLVEYLGIMDAEADRMISLINDLLDLGSLESGALSMKRDPVDMSDLLAYTVRSLVGMAGGKEVSLTVNQAGSAGMNMVSGDRGRLLQVLINLFANAIDFSPPGGLVAGTVLGEGRYVTVEILDQGPGVPPGDRDRIFEKYRQGNGTGRSGGKGLGLAIVKKIVDLHGGSVRIEDREDAAGSRFVLTLPALATEEE